MKREKPRIWIIALVLPGRWGGLLTAGLLSVVLLGLFATSGIFGIEEAPRGVALFFVAILAYIIPVFAWIATKAGECRDELASNFARPEIATAIDFERRSLRWQLTVIGAGFLWGLGHTGILYFYDNLDFSDVGWRISLVISLGSWMVWITLGTVITGLFEFAGIFQYFAREIDIDLFQINKLSPFSHIAIAFTLVLVGAQAALPLMLIQGFTLVGFVPGWLGLLIPMVVLMAMPVWSIHKSIVAVKHAELSKIASAIAERRAEMGAEVDDALKLNPLLVYRREIADVSEWPFDLSFFTRLCFYLLIPPVTWVGAALIEKLVEVFL